MPLFIRVAPVVFALTLFVSATLLFLVQPMIAKMILPKFGGAPAVWNSCMVFFQALLLAGYSYAHFISSRLGIRRQAVVHLAVLLVPGLALPLAITGDPPGEGSPVLWLLWLLLLSVGLPFFVVSTSAPLLQKWFAGTGHPSAQDPYFLYAASNVGSMLALIGYPLLVEPSMRLPGQSWLWTGGYSLLVLLTAACAFLAWRTHGDAETKTSLSNKKEAADSSSAPTTRQRLHWIALAFVPSSMMLGVTTYISTDLAPIPMIWVVPLALYLLSFILVFSRLPKVIHTTMVLALPVVVLLQAYLLLSASSHGLWTSILVNLATLFVTAMVCHGEMARRRPAPRYLTEFYLCMSLGGVLGGLFNAIVAPLVFKTLAEYSIALVLACLLMPRLESEKTLPPNPWLDFLLPAGLGLLMFGLLYWLNYSRNSQGEAYYSNMKWLYENMKSFLVGLGLEEKKIPSRTIAGQVLRYGIPILLCYALVSRPFRFGMGLGAVILACGLYERLNYKEILLRERSFFGVLKVRFEDDEDYSPSQESVALLYRTWTLFWQGQGHRVPDYQYHALSHGTTLHGMQRLDDEGKPLRNAEPTTYYHRRGPIGQLFAAFKQSKQVRPIALIGLGTGTLASYGERGQELTFYEIDALVERLARDTRYFTYLQDALDRGVLLQVVRGDARLSLNKPEVPDGHYHLIVVDAFSSDAIPVHLITKEALELYLRKLAPDGIAAFHISNRYLNLEPVLANLAADLNLAGIVQHDGEDKGKGKFASTWVLLSRQEKSFGALVRTIREDPDDVQNRWYRLKDHVRFTPKSDRPNVGVWTDDYYNIFRVFDWED